MIIVIYKFLADQFLNSAYYIFILASSLWSACIFYKSFQGCCSRDMVLRPTNTTFLGLGLGTCGLGLVLVSDCLVFKHPWFMLMLSTISIDSVRFILWIDSLWIKTFFFILFNNPETGQYLLKAKVTTVVTNGYTKKQSKSQNWWLNVRIWLRGSLFARTSKGTK